MSSSQQILKCLVNIWPFVSSSITPVTLSSLAHAQSLFWPNRDECKRNQKPSLLLMAFSDQLFVQELFLDLFPSEKICRCTTLALPLPRKEIQHLKKRMKSQFECACTSKKKKKGISQWIIKKTIRTSKNKAISGCTAYLQAQPAARPQERLTWELATWELLSQMGPRAALLELRVFKSIEKALMICLHTGYL